MPITKKFLTTADGINIYYEFIPNPNKPYLLLNHGNGNCITDWHSLAYVDQLRTDFQLIMVDARGFGKSDKPHLPSAYSEDKITGDFIAVLDEIGVVKCHYFGNSRGGSMGFIFAALHPHRFLSFSLFSAQPYGTRGPRLSKDFTLWLKKGIAYFVAKLEEALGKPFPQKLKKTFLKNDPLAILAANTLDWRDRSGVFYGDCTQPCLLAVGSRDPVADSNRKFVDKAKKMGNMGIQLHILKDFSHADVYWQSKVVSTLIKRFISDATHNEKITEVYIKPRSRL